MPDRLARLGKAPGLVVLGRDVLPLREIARQGLRIWKFAMIYVMWLNFYSYFLYAKSMIQELVLNDRLNVWNKGH